MNDAGVPCETLPRKKTKKANKPSQSPEPVLWLAEVRPVPSRVQVDNAPLGLGLVLQAQVQGRGLKA